MNGWFDAVASRFNGNQELLKVGRKLFYGFASQRVNESMPYTEVNPSLIERLDTFDADVESWSMPFRYHAKDPTTGEAGAWLEGMIGTFRDANITFGTPAGTAQMRMVGSDLPVLSNGMYDAAIEFGAILQRPTTVITEEEEPTVPFGPLTLSPAKDAYIDAVLDNAELGQSAIIRIGRAGSSNIWRGLMHFDLFDGTGLDAGSTVSLAEITVRITNTNTIAGFTVLVCDLTQTNWSETEVNWNRYRVPLDWVTPGGDFTEVDAAQIVWPSTTEGLFTFDVTALAQNAVTNLGGQLHILMKLEDDTLPGPGGSGEQTSFNSSDAASLNPFMEITGTI